MKQYIFLILCYTSLTLTVELPYELQAPLLMQGIKRRVDSNKELHCINLKENKKLFFDIKKLIHQLDAKDQHEMLLYIIHTNPALIWFNVRNIVPWVKQPEIMSNIDLIALYNLQLQPSQFERLLNSLQAVGFDVNKLYTYAQPMYNDQLTCATTKGTFLDFILLHMQQAIEGLEIAGPDNQPFIEKLTYLTSLLLTIAPLYNKNELLEKLDELESTTHGSSEVTDIIKRVNQRLYHATC